MSLEKAIIILAWVLSLLSFFLLIPEDKRRQAWVAFLFKQFLTWPLGILAVEYGLLEYPVRLIKYASKTSFSFEFLVYPIVCAFFNVFFPTEKSKMIKLGYYIAFTSSLTLLELLLENYTCLIVYLHWNAYCTWLSEFTLFFISRRYFCWFFKIK